MGTAYKTLAQAAPAANTLTDLYTVPGATSAIVSSLVAANRDAQDTTFRAAVAVGGAVDDVKQYIAWDIPVPANQSYVFTIGIALPAAAVLRVLSGNGLVSFNAFGQENT